MLVNQKQSLLHFRVEPAYKLRAWARVGFDIIGSKGKEGVPRLLVLLNDADPDICSTAAVCLASMGPSGDQAVPILTNRLRIANTKSGYARSEEATQVLVGLKFFDERAKPAVPLIIPLLKDADASIRHAAADALTRIDDEAATKARANSVLGLPNDWKPPRLSR